MSNVWMQSRHGRAIDLLEPRIEDVDFYEIAQTLADINRYAGAARPAVSVAFHTLIVFELAEPDIKPYALAHDAHEYVINDITTPTAMALACIGAEIDPTMGYGIVRAAIRSLKARHDGVIWAAAGLNPPTQDQEERIRHADRRALATERRDFLARSPKQWQEGEDEIAPSPLHYNSWSFGSTAKAVGEALYTRMVEHLPALAGNRVVVWSAS